MSGSRNALTWSGSPDEDDPLAQWLAEQRAKNSQSRLMADGMYPTDMGTMRPGTARVVPDKMYDVPPILDLGRIDEPSSPVASVQSQQWWDMYDALQRGGAPQNVLDYHMSQNPWVRIENRWTQEGTRSAQDADVVMRAIDARQRQQRR